MNAVPRSFVLIFLCCTGCAQLHEGSIDHRWAVPESNMPGWTLDHEFISAVANDRKIKPNDPISMTLETAFIHAFQEGFGEDGIVRGEIVILANVRPFGNDPVDYTNDAKNGARVIYYSADVRPHENGKPGQFLSLSSLPIYGPTIYDGDSVLIELHMLELDGSESRSIKALLNGLAQVGGAIQPAGSPVLSLLNTLGQALLSGAQDDSEFRYYATLHPNTKNNASTTRAYLQEGDLVIIKRGNLRPFYWTRVILPEFHLAESKEIPWDRLVLNPQDKRLYFTREVNGKKQSQECKDGGARKPVVLGDQYRDHTYFVINISTEFDASKYAMQSAVYQSFGEFSKIMNQDSPALTAALELDGALQQLSKDVRSRLVVQNAIELAAAIENNDFGVRGRRTTVMELLELLSREITDEDNRILNTAQIDEVLLALREAVPSQHTGAVDWDLFKPASDDEDPPDPRDLASQLGLFPNTTS